MALLPFMCGPRRPACPLEGQVCGELGFGALFIFLTCDTVTEAALLGCYADIQFLKSNSRKTKTLGWISVSQRTGLKMPSS